MNYTTWWTPALWLINHITDSLRGFRTRNNLQTLIKNVESKLVELKTCLREMDALDHAVRTYHGRRPGNQHDRTETEIEQDISHFIGRSHPKWTKEDYDELRGLFDTFIRDHPIPSGNKSLVKRV